MSNASNEHMQQQKKTETIGRTRMAGGEWSVDEYTLLLCKRQRCLSQI